MLTENQRRRLWEFVRGDVKMNEFEAWLYSDDSLEATLGNEVYLELIGCNFEHKEDIFKIRKSIRSVLEVGEDCQCASVRNLDSIDMGGDWFFETFFATQAEVSRPQTDQWWLYISHCNICGANWLVAQEERIHDVFYVQRISDQTVQNANNGNWPKQFQTYADVLSVGVDLGGPKASFVDPMSGALQVTVEELLQSNPKISAREIGQLLVVDPKHAQFLMNEVIRKGADPLAGFIATQPD